MERPLGHSIRSSPSVLLDGVDIHNADYGVWRPVYKGHAYREVRMAKVPDEE